MSETSMPKRRALHFEKLDDVTNDVQTLVRAESKGRLKHTGNWTLGQACNHIASWIDYGYDGLPIKVSLPLRMIGPLMRNRYLEKPMNPGGQLPNVPGGTVAAEPVSSEQGIEHLQKSIARLKKSVPDKPHPIFGKLKREQWIKLHLRHAELHLSFQRAE